MDIKMWQLLYEEVLREFAAIRREWLEWGKFNDFAGEMLAQYKVTAFKDLPVCVQHIAERQRAALVPMEELRARAARANQISNAIPDLAARVKTA